jgi:CBS domain-containing protein
VKGRLHGILTLEDLKSLPRERWAQTLIQSVMRPIVPEFFVGPTTTLDSAQELMKENGVGSIAVINTKGDLVGFLLRGKIKRSTKKKPRPR